MKALGSGEIRKLLCCVPQVTERPCDLPFVTQFLPKGKVLLMVVAGRVVVALQVCQNTQAVERLGPYRRWGIVPTLQCFAQPPLPLTPMATYIPEAPERPCDTQAGLGVSCLLCPQERGP